MQSVSLESNLARQFLLAPLAGALAGFLVNRARRGDAGWPMLLEMAAGAALIAAGAVILSQLNAASERAQNAAARRRAAWLESEALRAEQARYAHVRAQYEQALAAAHQPDIAAELERSRRNTARLAGALANLIAHVDKSARHAPVTRPTEAQARIIALESAQAELARRQVELDQKTMREAEEVKTRLLALNISDTQRLRNVSAPGADQSGRLIELEARIRKLAGEIERLSARQPAAVEAGEASKVAPGGTGEGAKLGFLKAMLEANQTLRKKIQEAA